MDFIDHRSNATFQFKISSSSERAKIDDSGNLLVGKSSTSIGTVGAEVRGVGQLWATRDGGTPIAANRLTSHGELQAFYKDGVKVGSIQSASGDLTVGTTDTGFRFLDSSEAIIPWDVTGNTNKDAAIDLGNTSNRFADLHLSGAANVGGNATITGDLYVSNGQIFLGTADSSSGHVNAYELMTFNIDTDNDDTNRYFKWTTNASSGSGTQLMYLDESGDLTVSGNLTVQGTQTSLEVATLQVEDNNIVLNYGTGDTSGSADGAGITIQDAVDDSNDATILWNATNDKFVFSHDISVTGASFADNAKAFFGTGNDLSIFHDGSNSYVKDTGTGDLMLQGVNVRIQGATTGNNMFVGVDNGASTLYYQNNARLATTSAGIDVTGTITADNNLTIQNSSAYGSIELGGVSGGFIDIKRPFSDDYDLRLIAEGDGGVINVASGELTIQRAGSAKLATSSDGVEVTGTFTASGNLQSDDITIKGGTGTTTVSTLTFENYADTAHLKSKYTNPSATTETYLAFHTNKAGDSNGTVSESMRLSGNDLSVNGTITFAGGTTSADLNFGDNDKAVFGAGSDLSIYHDSNNSYIVDSGTGNLYINANEFRVGNADNSKDYIHGNNGAEVKLFYNNAPKLATSSTGIDVTGSITADGLTLDNNGSIIFNDPQATDTVLIGTNDNELILRTDDGDITLKTNENKQQLRVSNNGDVSLYEDTGTTAKFFWDASAERLGIGASAPGSLLELEATGSTVFDGTATDGQAADGTTLAIQNLSDTNNTFSQILFRNRNASKAVSRIASLTDSTGTEMAFVVENNGSPAEVLRLEKTGFAGLGTAAPAAKLDIVDTSADVQMRVYKNDGTKNTRVTLTADDSGAKIHYRDADNAGALRFNNNLGEVMRITANTTRVGIGTTNPTNTLTVFGTGAGNATVQIEGEGGADPYINFLANNAQHWSLGVDDSDADKFKLSEHSALGTNDYLVVDVTGQVGIGTSPDRVFHVSRSSASVIAGKFESASTSGSQIVFVDADTTTNDLQVRIGSDANDLVQYAGGSERLRIDSSGRVGIGTVSPTTLLEIKDTTATAGLCITADNASNSDLNLGDEDDVNIQRIRSDHTSNSLQFQTNNAERMRLTSSGQLALGTTTPEAFLDVRGNTQIRSATDGEVQLRIRNTSTGTSSVAQLYLDGQGNNFYLKNWGDGTTKANATEFLTTAGSSYFIFATANAERMRLDASGNLGLGTGSAEKRLHIYDSTQTNQTIRFGNPAATPLADINYSSIGYEHLYISVKGTTTGYGNIVFSTGPTPSEVMRLDASGNASLGTATPLYTAATRTTFTINGLGSSNLSFGANGTGYGNIFVASNEMNIGTQTSANPLKFVIGGSEKARLDASGNLLVGKTAADTATVGAAVFNYGMGAFTRASSHALDLNRTTSDGSIINLRKNNTTVGTVGTIVGYLTIGTSDTGIIFNDDYNAVYPWNVGSNGGSDGLLDLGVSDRRWKDIYLKGNMNFLGGTNDAQYIKFGDSDDDDIGNIFYYHGNNNMVFTTNASEAFRVDGSGNLLVGKTSAGIANVGVEARGNGLLFATTNQTECLQLNRLNSDGTLLILKKDGAVIGDFGSTSGSMYIQGYAGTGKVGLTFYGSSIEPRDNGAAADNAVDLGATGTRFKDIHLGGTAYIDTAVGIGSSPTYPLDVRLGTAGSIVARFKNASGFGLIVTPQVGGSGSVTDLSLGAGESLSFSPNNTEIMRLETGGNVLIGKTAINNTTQGIRFLGSSGFMSIVRSAGTNMVVNRIDSDGNLIEIRRNGTTVGSISATTSATSFNTTSDERAKENIVDAPSASDDIDAIRVRSFDFKADGSHQKYGMIAQELSTVAPEAVSVPDDAEEMQSVDYSKLVPMLVKEIQSLRARVAQLEGEN